MLATLFAIILPCDTEEVLLLTSFTRSQQLCFSRLTVISNSKLHIYLCICTNIRCGHTIIISSFHSCFSSLFLFFVFFPSVFLFLFIIIFTFNMFFILLHVFYFIVIFFFMISCFFIAFVLNIFFIFLLWLSLQPDRARTSSVSLLMGLIMPLDNQKYI